MRLPSGLVSNSAAVLAVWLATIQDGGNLHHVHAADLTTIGQDFHQQMGLAVAQTTTDGRPYARGNLRVTRVQVEADVQIIAVSELGQDVMSDAAHAVFVHHAK